MSNVVRPDSKNLPVEQPAQAPRNIFEDPTIAAAAQNDPFVRFVVKHGKAILISLGAVVLAMVAYDRFTVTQQHKKAQLTQDVRGVQKDYEVLVGKLDELSNLKAQSPSTTEQQEKVKALEAEIQQIKERGTLKLTALETSGAFPDIVRLYRGLIAARTGELDKVKGVLSSGSWEQLPEGSSERLVAELTSLALAKSLIDSETHRDVAKQTLVALAERGTVAAAQAVLALHSLASTDEEKAEVKKLVEGVHKRLPSQRKYLVNVSEG